MRCIIGCHRDKSLPVSIRFTHRIQDQNSQGHKTVSNFGQNEYAHNFLLDNVVFSHFLKITSQNVLLICIHYCQVTWPYH